MNKPGSKHLTKEERKIIERCLNEGLTCKEIACIIDKDERSVSREVKKWRQQKENGKYGLYNKKDTCSAINRFPYVCNHCSKRQICFAQYKYYYDADYANTAAKQLLSECRTGLDVTLEEKIKFDTILYEGIKKGQSIHHIVQAHKDALCYSERSAYRLVDQQKTVVQAIDLRRKVKLKPRKHYVQKSDNSKFRNGRKYSDFIEHLAKNPTMCIAELDTVEGPREGAHKCLLTIHSTATHFMLIYVLPAKEKKYVSAVLESLKLNLGVEMFQRFFSTSLTDRGSEFCNPEAIELNPATGELLCHLFYCNSYSSYQKGAIEENHELIRYIIPKGIAFDDLTQEKANLMASHINSYYRKSIDSSPYELALSYYGKEFLEKTKIREINPDLVTLKPSLIK